jgi:hypothetical protein
MRTIQWLFVVGAVLFVTGIAFVIAGAREARSAGPPVEVARAGKPVATIKQIMNGITQPNAAILYASVGTVVGTEGTRDIAPQTDEEWSAVGNSAAALIESGNLLLMDGRAVDDGDWVSMTNAFIAASTAALAAADDKSTDGILSAGAKVYATCEACHQRYQQ